MLRLCTETGRRYVRGGYRTSSSSGTATAAPKGQFASSRDHSLVSPSPNPLMCRSTCAIRTLVLGRMDLVSMVHVINGR